MDMPKVYIQNKWVNFNFDVQQPRQIKAKAKSSSKAKTTKSSGRPTISQRRSKEDIFNWMKDLGM